MRLFQLLAVPMIVVMLLMSARNFRSRPAPTLFWTGLWLATLLAVVYPDTTTQLARVLGIYRGADLLVYSAVLAFIGGFYVVSLRLRQLSREITLLTREVALLEAERKQNPETRRSA